MTDHPLLVLVRPAPGLVHHHRRPRAVQHAAAATTGKGIAVRPQLMGAERPGCVSRIRIRIRIRQEAATCESATPHR